MMTSLMRHQKRQNNNRQVRWRWIARLHYHHLIQQLQGCAFMEKDEIQRHQAQVHPHHPDLALTSKIPWRVFTLRKAGIQR
jgi:hypothetical protein